MGRRKMIIGQWQDLSRSVGDARDNDKVALDIEG